MWQKHTPKNSFVSDTKTYDANKQFEKVTSSKPLHFFVVPYVV